jgi:hypothetical protein
MGGTEAMKLQYEVLSMLVDKLYEKEFPEGDDAAIEAHCKFIADTIRSAGWDEQEYMERWLQEVGN